MLWVDTAVADIKSAFADKIAAGETLIVRDEKTLSGRPHIGSIRSASMHAFIVDALVQEQIEVKYLYEINDTDALDTVPAYVPAEFEKYIGFRLKDIPSPSGTHENYAEEMAEDYCQTMLDAGFPVEFYRQSAHYEAGKYDEWIRISLDKKDAIQKIYKDISGSDKPESWYPVQVICEGCGKIATTNVTDWDGEQVSYECISRNEFTGCGHSGQISPFGGNGTLPWKVEWAAKWAVTDTDIEGAGKDHYTAGGSRQVANAISEQVFDRAHPFDMRHEFILIGGAKMSSSKGVGATAGEVAGMLPKHVFRFMLVIKDIMKTIDFSPDGDTIPLLFDAYDAAARAFSDPEKRALQPNESRAYELVWAGQAPPPALQLPKFSQIVFLCQMPHLDLEKSVAEMKGSELTADEQAELAVRIAYAKKWLADLAPERYRFHLGDYSAGLEISDKPKQAIQKMAEFLAGSPDATGHDIHTRLHELKGELDLQPKELFQPFYQLLLDRESGPQLGFMLASLPREETLAILKKVI